MPENIGDFIRERRQDLGLSQEELANRVGGGMRQADISRLEHNRVTLPRRARLELLARALNVSLGELLVHTGWLDGEHVPELAERGMPLVQLDLDTLLQLDGLFTEVEQAAAAIARARQSIADILGTVTAAQPTRPDVPVAAGVMHEWEHSALFIA